MHRLATRRLYSVRVDSTVYVVGPPYDGPPVFAPMRPFLPLLALSAFAHGATSSLDGIYSLVQRQIPDHANSFAFSLLQADGDTFVLSDAADSGGIDIQCSTVSACARGLYT